MAEFIAEDPVHVAVASEQQAIYDNKGRQVEPKQRRVFAKFVRGVAPEYAQKVALEAFSFRKIHEGIEKARWFGYYNSRDAQQQFGWTEAEHDLIVAKLRERGYQEVQPVRAPAPWPAYDALKAHGQRKIEHVVEKILAAITDLGVDPQVVLEYEKQNLNRQEIVDAITVLTAGEESEAEPLIAA